MKQTWIDYLPADVSRRLEECRNTKEDLPVLVEARWRWDKEHDPELTKEDSLTTILDWLDSNHQWSLCDMSREEYDRLIRDTEGGISDV